MTITSWDSLFKQLFLRFFQRRQLPVDTEYEVSYQAQSIDAVTLCPTEAHRQRLGDTAFSFFKHHNLIEFKSTTDRLTEDEYYLITSRARAYLHQTRGANLENTVSCIVSTGRPRNVLTRIPRLEFNRVERGHYLANELLNTHLYVLAELPIEPKYYPLLLFAAGRKRGAVLQTFVDRNEIELIQIALSLYPETMRRIYTMPRGDYPTIEENIDVLLDWFGYDTFTKAYLKSHPQMNRNQIRQFLQSLVSEVDKNQVRQFFQDVLAELDNGENTTRAEE